MRVKWLAQNTTQCLRTALEPGELDLETSAKHEATAYYLAQIVNIYPKIGEPIMPDSKNVVYNTLVLTVTNESEWIQEMQNIIEHENISKRVIFMCSKHIFVLAKFYVCRIPLC